MLGLSRPRVPTAAWIVAAGAITAGCNAIFGISPGTVGDGGAASSSSSSSAASSSGSSGAASSSSGGGAPSCGYYAGQSSAAWTALDGGTPSVPVGSFDTSTNTNAQMYTASPENVTELSFAGGGEVGATGFCYWVYVALQGEPTPGRTYTLLDGSFCTPPTPATIASGPVGAACVVLGAVPFSDMTCQATQSLFGSVAGSGSLQVTFAEGNDVAIELTDVVLAGVASSGASGSFQLSMTATAQCFMPPVH